MSGHRTPAGNAEVHIPVSASPSTCIARLHWRQARLIEARGILADIAHHPDTLAHLACRVIRYHTTDPDERTDALGMMRLLNAHPPESANAALKGGAL